MIRLMLYLINEKVGLKPEPDPPLPPTLVVAWRKSDENISQKAKGSGWTMLRVRMHIFNTPYVG
jgi:hypothetical protein